jgi:hypothetical protein
MSGYKLISEFFSEDGLKTANVVKNLTEGNYIVRFKNDAGSIFSATYPDLDSAEEYAEDWVI